MAAGGPRDQHDVRAHLESSNQPINRYGLRTKAVAEGDGVFAMLTWLNRTPESFLPGADGGDLSGANRLPDVPPASGLRFDAKKLHAAVNVQRVARGLTWQQVGREIGLGAATLTHLSRGGRTGFPHVMRSLAGWAGRSRNSLARLPGDTAGLQALLVRSASKSCSKGVGQAMAACFDDRDVSGSRRDRRPRDVLEFPTIQRCHD
jgi:hypothetical protein